MQSIHRNILRSLFLTLLLAPSSITPAASQVPDFNNIDNFDQFEADEAIVSALENEQVRACPPPQEIAQNLIDIIVQFNGLAFLQEDLYLRTNPLNERSLLDYPFIFVPQKLYYNSDWILGANLFYNQTTRSWFTRNCDNFSAYLAVSSPTLIEKLSLLVSQIQPIIPGFNLDPTIVLPLFENGTVQERRLGLMFHAMRQFKSANLRFMMPFYYLERNYFFTQEEKEDIEKELGAMNPEQQEIFQSQHLISDKVGLGDARLEIDFLVRDCDTHYIRLGSYLTIPTAVPLIQGLKGAHFDPCSQRSDFNLIDIFPCGADPMSIKDQATQSIQKFLTQTLDLLSANVLDSPLGNGGHFGLAGTINTKNNFDLFFKRHWASQLAWINKISLEYLFPGTEKRFFVARPNTAEFTSRNFMDEDQALSNLAFLNQELINRFMPYVCNAFISPGIVFHWLSKAQYEGEKWSFDFGADFWVKGKESFRNVQAPPKLLALLELPKANLPLATQMKLLTGFYYKLERQTHDWIFALNGDYSVLSRGIGRDFMITFNFESNF
jgi:hypothetical protein